MNTERRERLKKYLLRLLSTQGERAWQWMPAAEDIKAAIIRALTAPEVLEHPLRIVPTQYHLFLHPQRLKPIQRSSQVSDEIAIAIHAVGKAIGARFAVLPRVIFKPDETLPPNGFRLQTKYYEPEILHSLPLTMSAKDVPRDAYFLVQGSKIFPLNAPIVHIGRRADNDLVINDPRVSRIHAQLRATGGRYRLIDLNSTGGTFINNNRITNTVLYPGDMISIAGVIILYGQRTTRPLSPISTSKVPNHTSKVDTIISLEPPKDQTKSDKGEKK